MTSHLAFRPHVPEHGLAHLNLWHALFCGHSALTVHSGLQFGGEPIYSSTQEQTATPFASRHLLLGPHGDGLHGSDLTGISGWTIR